MYNDNLNPSYPMSSGRVSTGFATFMIGTAVGAGLALLLAPATGSDTRRKVGETVRHLGGEARHKIGQVKDKWNQRGQGTEQPGTEAFQSSHEPSTYR